MDQDYFRTLLSSSSQKSGNSSTSRGSLLSNGTTSKSKPETISSSEAAFKPRKVKKLDRYRDRAAERRLGEGNDYAQVEALLEDFEKSTADQDAKTVEEKRRYLGGDGDHSILVKGLDMALLELNKAKAAMATDEDDQLEEAFRLAEAPKKRTREDIIRELKEKRAQGSEVEDSTEQEAPLAAAAKGKFKPIGFKPIGAPIEEKPKKRKAGESEKKKKKRKMEGTTLTNTSTKAEPASASTKMSKDEPTPSQPAVAQSMSEIKEASPEPPDDFDIFADAGEYEGVDVGNDDDESGEEEKHGPPEKEEGRLINPALKPGRWFVGDDEGGPPSKPDLSQPIADPSVDHTKSPKHVDDGEDADDPDQMHLVPLEGSAMPSIKDFLAMDEAAELAEKKRKRKEKQKTKKGDSDSKMTAEAKANRDYQRLKSFTDKRGG